MKKSEGCTYAIARASAAPEVAVLLRTSGCMCSQRHCSLLLRGSTLPENCAALVCSLEVRWNEIQQDEKIEFRLYNRPQDVKYIKGRKKGEKERVRVGERKDRGPVETDALCRPSTWNQV